VRFLDNFTTASLAPLTPGQATEGFFADGRGHVIALVRLLRMPDGIWIDGAPGLAGTLHEHLEHYHIREDVSFHDASSDRRAFLVRGPAAAAVGVATPAHDQFVDASLGGIATTLMATDWYGVDGVLVFVATADADRLAAWLATTGLPQAGPADVDAARIDAGSPEPADIPPKTLPQELGRDARAICFTKGCYLGQETVARLDALGHVNRRLVGIATGDTPPAVGADVLLDGTPVGAITSACVSPTLGAGLGLGLVHVKAVAPTARPTVGGTEARVIPLPVGRGDGEHPA
jgi:folate-binding protein YgfZ